MCMLFTETALGRLVPRGTPPELEQKIVLRDLVLKVLFDSWRSPFNPAHEPLSREALERITLVERELLDKIVNELVRERLIIKVGAELALTPAGFEEIQRVPNWAESIAP